MGLIINQSVIIPSGSILMWHGPIASIPSGWALCNGSSGTPDLRDVFIVGAKQDSGGIAKTNITGALTQTGGAATHTLITNEMPSHTHDIIYGGNGVSTPTGTTNTDGNTSYVPTEATGGGLPHNNLPNYYALAFIMKL